MSKAKNVFITVKTYPTLSRKYDELVCTAGILEDGSWVRIYPVPFRKLSYEEKYKKYQWLSAPLKKSTEDPRPESYKVTDIESDSNWRMLLVLSMLVLGQSEKR